MRCIFFLVATAVATTTLRKEAAAAGVLDSAVGGLEGKIKAADCYGKAGHSCSKNSDCCAPMVCGSGKECGGCKANNVACQNNGQCCSDVCGVGGKCSGCNGLNGNCDSNGDCCDSLVCGGGNKCSTCNGVGGECNIGGGSGATQCCDGLECDYDPSSLLSPTGRCEEPGWTTGSAGPGS